MPTRSFGSGWKPDRTAPTSSGRGRGRRSREEDGLRGTPPRRTLVVIDGRVSVGRPEAVDPDAIRMGEVPCQMGARKHTMRSGRADRGRRVPGRCTAPETFGTRCQDPRRSAVRGTRFAPGRTRARRRDDRPGDPPQIGRAFRKLTARSKPPGTCSASVSSKRLKCSVCMWRSRATSSVQVSTT